MPTEPEPVYDDETGELVCYAFHNDAGEGIYFDADTLQVLGVADTDGEMIDPAEYGELYVSLDQPSGVLEAGELFADAGDGAIGEQELVAMSERMDALEQDQAEPQQPVMVTPADPLEHDSERVAAAMARQRHIWEAAEGRALTRREAAALGSEMIDQVRLGGEVDIYNAASQLAWRNDRDVPSRDLNDDADRQAHMVERMQDAERRERADEYGDDDLVRDVEPWRATATNLSDDRERQEYMAQRLLGNVPDDHVVYDSGSGAAGQPDPDEQYLDPDEQYLSQLPPADYSEGAMP